MQLFLHRCFHRPYVTHTEKRFCLGLDLSCAVISAFSWLHRSIADKWSGNCAANEAHNGVADQLVVSSGSEMQQPQIVTRSHNSCRFADSCGDLLPVYSRNRLDLISL